MYEKAAPQHNSRNIMKTYLEEPDKQTSERSSTMDSKKRCHMLPPTAKIVQPVSTSSDGIYMSLTLTTEKREQKEQESQYMSLSAATRETHSDIWETGAWKRVQASQDAALKSLCI
jgi:hypothetical protein